MKNNNLIKSTIIILLIAIVALILVSGTYAKYTSSASGTDTATVAKWKINVNGTDITQIDTVTFDLFKTILDSDIQNSETDVKEGYIAPGTSGSFELEVENASDVTAKYSISFEVVNGPEGIPIEYSVDKSEWKTNVEDLNISDSTLSVGDAAASTTIYWRWAYETYTDVDQSTVNTARDTSDTSIGVTAQNGATYQIKATITATQED